MLHKVYLALGSNMGDREDNLKNAIDYIANIENTFVKSISYIYETRHVGYENQNDFLNMAVYIETVHEPLALLNRTNEIEGQLKRVRDIHWGPRTIDIDILLYDELKVDYPQLIIPHPRMFERAFVLIPLKDIYPFESIAGLDIYGLIENCGDKNDIKPYKSLKYDIK